ncbi:hypothetical protein BH09MYX1_BH09MYX1_43100 [soil metagenome]
MSADADADETPTVVEGAGTSPSSAAASPSRDVSLLDVIGRGGMGVVFRGEQTELGRVVAFKQLLDGSDQVLRRRFLREARLTAQLDHPNVVPVHSLEVRESSGAIGYSMKLVEGKTLRALIVEAAAAVEAGGPGGAGEAVASSSSLIARLEIFLKMCDAVAFAHAKNVLHRDLKPANVMIGRFGEVYVMDWGIARFLDSARGAAAPGAARAPSVSASDAAGADATADDEDAFGSEPTAPTAKDGTDAELTRQGEVLGTASYMSPEQAAGRHRALDGRSDQYSLGLILFELASLLRAITGPSFADALALAVAGKKVALTPLDPKERIAPELRAIIEKATAFLPDARYATVALMAEDVRRFLRDEAVLARPENGFAKLLRAMSKHRRATFVAMIGALAIGALAVAYAEVRKASAALEAREREGRRTAFSIEVATQAHRIDAQLQQMEEALEGLSTAATWALDGPEPADGPRLYFAADFANPARRPSDFTGRTSYRWEVSMGSPVVELAPGVDREAILPKIRRLAPLGQHMQTMFVRANTRDRVVLSAAEEMDVLLQRRGPIDYAYVDLAEGVHFVYPGMNALVPYYDVRSSGFYLLSDHRHGKRWGAPYIDATTDPRGDDLVLPCTEGLWSKSGAFLGVAGVEMTVTKLVETELVLPNRATIRTSLLDRDGHEIIDSGDAGKLFHGSGKDEALVLSDFDIPEIAAAVREGREGMRDVRKSGRDEVVVFVRLEVLDWYYVVEIDPALVR